ncbi:alkaline phosphatase D family protein [Williamsia phyllosphaerae]|uniref:Alkaline phosphatase n=1 Tax=Williamsia phyllosphaerae TaxID=885042 RepID=A0ABQ1V108_9NOCA|nr:alkaline phosphatase D family protein [Williamsia phyllosphaerae]GGF32469.1 alkaline phosphatase [Williamsia phyllosphaerae]
MSPRTPAPSVVVGADKTIRHGVTRRRFLTWTGVAGALAFTPGLFADAAPLAAAPSSGDHLFTLGVASGDPLPDGVVLWTRLASAPLARGGGMGTAPVPVEWELATDEKMTSVVRRGRVIATAADGHSVHVDVRGLSPAREYFYRFRSGAHISDVGRTRTAPAAGSPLAALTFAWASCQSWGDGFFNAYEDMASFAPDVVFHLGDYVYEKGIPAGGGRRNTTALPASCLSEMMTLDDYRDRYALYKLDPQLQRAHRVSPFITVFDDHEVENNWAGAISEDNAPIPQFLARRAQAMKAWWENTPVRAAQRPLGPDVQAYRRFDFGDLARFDVLDTRQYRSDQVNGDMDSPQNAQTADPRRTITGARQERWILDSLGSSRRRWNVLAHQTTIADLARETGGERKVSMDGWSGYEASRARILDGARERRVRNLVSIVGDIHRSVVSDLRSTYTRESPTVGIELAGTSVASGKDGADSDASDKQLKAASPHIRFGNAQRGYVLNRLTRAQWQAEFRVADSIADPRNPLHRRAVVTIPDGRPQADVSA